MLAAGRHKLGDDRGHIDNLFNIILNQLLLGVEEYQIMLTKKS